MAIPTSSGEVTKAYTLREMARRTRALSGNGLPLYSESALRAFTRRAENPLPSVSVGEKRPHVYVFDSVVRAFIAFEMGVVPYADVVEAAGRCAMGARQ
jgi:hypothetical protein